MSAAGIEPALLPLLCYRQNARPLTTRPSPTHPNKGGRRESNPRRLVHSQSPEPLGYDHLNHNQDLTAHPNGQTGIRTPNLCVQNRCVPLTPSAQNQIAHFRLPAQADLPHVLNRIALLPTAYCLLPTADCLTKTGAQGIEPCLRRFGVIRRPIWPHPPCKRKAARSVRFDQTGPLRHSQNMRVRQSVKRSGGHFGQLLWVGACIGRQATARDGVP